MRKFYYEKGFRRNVLLNNIKRVKLINLNLRKKTIQKQSLENEGVVSEITEYLEENKVKRKIGFKSIFKKRAIQVSLLLVLSILIGVGVYMSQTKKITLIINGAKKEYRTNQYFSSVLIEKLAKERKFKKYKSSSSSEDTIKDNTVITINSLKKITTSIKLKKEIHETYTNTLPEFLEEQKPSLSQYNGKYSYYVNKYPKVEQQQSVKLKGEDEIELSLLSRKVVEKTIEKKYKTKYVDNKKVESGKVQIKQKGQNLKYVKKYEMIYLNDKEYDFNKTVSKVLQKGQTKIIERGTKPTGPSNSVWDRLAKCETGGRWHLNSGNGFYGGLQFSAATWNTASAKAGVSAPFAHLASKQDQIKAATWLQKNSGWGQWPHCSSKLGLR